MVIFLNIDWTKNNLQMLFPMQDSKSSSTQKYKMKVVCFTI